MEEGMKEQRRSGLPRRHSSACDSWNFAGKGTGREDRFSHFLWVLSLRLILDALVARKILVENIPVVITGNEALAESLA